MKLGKNSHNEWIDAIFESKWSMFFIVVITGIIVLPNIARESLWVDEIFSALASLKISSVHAMFTEYIFKDVHPPLYQIILYY